MNTRKRRRSRTGALSHTEAAVCGLAAAASAAAQAASLVAISRPCAVANVPT